MPMAGRPRLELGERADSAFVPIYTISASLVQGPPKSTLNARCKQLPWGSQLGGVPLAVVRSDPPQHSRGRSNTACLPTTWLRLRIAKRAGRLAPNGPPVAKFANFPD